MWTILVLCSLIASRGFCGDADAPPADGKDPAGDSQAAAADEINPAARPSCRGRCGGDLGSCSCTSSCQNSGNCCHDYNSYCPVIKAAAQRWYTTSAPRSCRYNCGYHLGSCSCSSSCRYNGNCCHDYNYYCNYGTTYQPATTGHQSCRYRCGSHLGSCSCSSSCQYYGNCCYDYYSYCYHTSSATTSAATSVSRSCRYNCGSHLGSCSCSSSCRYNGNCCHDYNYYCNYGTTTQTATTGHQSCRYRCGSHLGSCSCSSSCQYYGNCCNDYYSYCYHTTASGTTSVSRSCRYNCGYHLGSCSCSSSCRYNGNCCHDYNYYCNYGTTYQPTTTGHQSCRYNCGYHLGSCSCSSSCQYYGNCCYDYNYYCSYQTTTSAAPPVNVTASPSCRYNCGYHLGSCSCTSSCRYYGDCCYDYSYQCNQTTNPPSYTTGHQSCRYYCGSHLGSCSCSSSCQYYGNCCYDYYYYCSNTTSSPPTTGCGGSLYGSGSFASPNHPNSYPNSARCVWYLSTSYNERIFLSFPTLQMENCCSCDYVAVYDGPSTSSRYLGKVCSGSVRSFQSSSNYLTAVFRSDGSVVGQGFRAVFTTVLSPNLARVDCSSSYMNIIISRSYLNSLGYDGYSLYLNDPRCRPSVQSYQVVFNFPINSCGTTRQIENGSVVYTNAVRGYNSSYGEITRQSHLKLEVGCHMQQNSTSHIMFVAQQHGNSAISGTGNFNTSMAFYTSSNFYNQVTQYPYKVALNQNMYVQVSMLGGDSSLVVFIDTCETSPYPSFYSRRHYLVRNGCTMDNTYYSYISGSRNYARFTFKAFQFLRASEAVYMRCTVAICLSSDYNSRCRRGCYRRAARDVTSKHETKTLVLGPIQLKGPEKQEEETPKEDKA